MSLDLRDLVETLGSPQPRLHAGHKILTAQVNPVPKTLPNAGMALLFIPLQHGFLSYASRERIKGMRGITDESSI
jgi:hypothetical protein